MSATKSCGYIVHAPACEASLGRLAPLMRHNYAGMMPLVPRLKAAPELRGRVRWLAPRPADDEMLCLAHSAEYLKRVDALSQTDPAAGLSMLQVPLYPEVVQFFRLCAGGTALAAETAVKTGANVCTLTGGWHHAFRDRASGFCLFNDIAVAAAHVLRSRLARRVLVIDCDLHQGDGTASIFADDDRVFTFSIHNEQAFPAVKQQSDLDIPLRAGTGTDLYLKSLAAGLSWIPDERFDVIIYQAGIDIHENDQLGGLRVSAEGIATRDRLVRDFARDRALPVVITPGGGYGKDVEAMLAIRYEMLRTSLLP